MPNYEVYLDHKLRFGCIEAKNEQEARTKAVASVKETMFMVNSLQCSNCKKSLKSSGALTAHEYKCNRTVSEITHDSILQDLAKNLRPHFTIYCSLVEGLITVHDKPNSQFIANIKLTGQDLYIGNSRFRHRGDKINVANPDYINQVIEMLTTKNDELLKIRNEN